LIGTFVRLLFVRRKLYVILPGALSRFHRANVSPKAIGAKNTFDEGDRQIDVNVADSSLSSCKQSASPGDRPGAAAGFEHASLGPEKKVENMLIRLPIEVGEVGVRDTIVDEGIRGKFYFTILFKRTKKV